MDPVKLSDNDLREKLATATFDAENLIDRTAKRRAEVVRRTLQAEADKRFKRSNRFNRFVTRTLGRILGADKRDLAQGERHLRSKSEWKDR
jgi:hypothetical protein